MSRKNRNKFRGPATPQPKSPSIPTPTPPAVLVGIPAWVAKDDRDAFSKLHAQCVAQYHPAGEAAHAVVGEIAAYQWKAQRNNQMEAAIFSRELLRQAESFDIATLQKPNSLELALAAQEALTGNKTIAELRRDTMHCLRAASLLQRQLKDLQKNWLPADPEPAGNPEAQSPAEPTPPMAEMPANPLDTNGLASEIAGRTHPGLLGLTHAEFLRRTFGTA